MVERYVELTLQIEPARDGIHPVIVRSRAGQGRGTFRAPFAEEESPLKPGPRGRAREVRQQHRPASLGIRETGDRLFRAFSGQVRSLLESNLTIVGNRSGHGLRIKLQFAPCPELAAVRNLPWELLYWSDRRTFLVLNHRTSVVRSLSVPRPISPLRIEPPLRILAVSAMPAPMGLLDVEREKRALQHVCEELPDVDVSFLEDATAPALLRHLKKAPFHVLHFMGHGGFDPVTGTGSLLLDDERRGSQPAQGQALAQILGTSPSLRLTVLNACNTARSARRRTAEIAAALVDAQGQDAADRGWPINRALRDLAHHHPGLLPAGAGTMRRALRKSSALLHAFRLDPAWRRIGLALYGDADGPERMHRDSPLTPHLIAALDSGHPPARSSPS